MNESGITENQIQAYVDGRLPAGEHARVRALLDRDPARRAEVEAEIALMARLRGDLIGAAGQHEDPTTDQLVRDLAHRLDGARRRRMALQACAAAALIAVGWLGNMVADRLLGVPEDLQLAVAGHELFANSAYGDHPMIVAESDLESAFGRLLGVAIDIPDLSGNGLTLVAGRLIELTDGPVVQVLYEDRRRERFSLYLAAGAPGDAQSGDSGLSEISLVEVDGLTTGSWTEGGTQLTVVADEPAEQVMALALEISQAVPSGGIPQ